MIPEPEVPGMPLVPDTMFPGPVQNSSWKQISIKTWVLVLLIFIVAGSEYGVFKMGYYHGAESVYSSPLYTSRKKNQYSDPIYSMNDLEANLQDTDNPKSLILSIHLAISNDSGLFECASREAELRDKILSVLLEKRSWDIDTLSEENKLKRLIRDELNATLSTTKVRDIFFSKYKIRHLAKENLILLETK